MRCHNDENEKTITRSDGTVVNIFVPAEPFVRSVHGERLCTDCHHNITDLPHEEPLPLHVSCVECHQNTLAEQEGAEDPRYKRLDVVVAQIDRYMHSVHARPSTKDSSKINATCYDCHDAHNIGAAGSQTRAEARLKNPMVCGKCHQKQMETYRNSVHGKEVLEKHNRKAAVCSDCHTSHTIDATKADNTKLLITQQCGGCHDDEYRTYMGTYHGQVNRLGYAYTAKCFDCHGAHDIKRVDDPASRVHVNNRLEACNKCHKDATQGFISYHPHGNTHDFERFPYMWIAAKFMLALVFGVFAFFWTHTLLWFYREYRDRKEGRHRAYVLVDRLPESGKEYIRRFSWPWRIVHLLLALAVMTLVLTGTTVLYAETFWAPTVMKLLGGTQRAAFVHRIAASVFVTIFLGHLVYLAIHVYRNRKTFKWFGPTSLLPNLQDFRDAAEMFRWFFGRGHGHRPVFDRWAYWEKFDYWAPFWGMFVIGTSGVILWFSIETAARFPGWVFNVATIVHGEEAFLAAVFIFTVHYFNAHFRPDKFPQDIVMFTGAVSLEEFRLEHTLEYKRLADSGELEQYLVHAPSRPMTLASKALGAILIVFGLFLLFLILQGFVHKMAN
jgi:cytochrome b subunit of formate dehydrogenase